MAQALVVADASPLIGLAAAGALDLLRGLSSTVTVAAAVYDEVLAGGVLPGARELESTVRAGWMAVASGAGDVDGPVRVERRHHDQMAKDLELDCGHAHFCVPHCALRSCTSTRTGIELDHARRPFLSSRHTTSQSLSR